MSNSGVTCPACAESASRPIMEVRLLRFHHCRACDLVFVHPQPRDRVREKYTRSYDLARHFGEFAPRKRVLFERRLDRLPLPRQGQRLCDVGCADGQFLQVAAERGWKTFGIELNPPAAEAAQRRGAEVVTGVLEERDDLPWGAFDVVTSWDVLEHTPDPRPFSERLVRLVAPGGRLVVSTLNYRSLVRFCFGARWSMVCEDHFTYWSARSLERLFTGYGLQRIGLTTFGVGRDFFAVLDRRAKKSSTREMGPFNENVDGSWDVNPSILAAENLCNRAFGAFGGGVGLEAVFSKV